MSAQWRLKIWHDRDRLVRGDNHWNLSAVDQTAPAGKRKLEMVGWGSYEACRATAAALVDTWATTGIRP